MIHKETNPFYNRAAWKDVAARRRIMDLHLCVDCVERFERGGSEGVRDAAMVHHVLPLDQRPDLALDIHNLRSLCNACHNKRHPEKRDKALESAPPSKARQTLARLAEKGVNVIKL